MQELVLTEYVSFQILPSLPFTLSLYPYLNAAFDTVITRSAKEVHTSRLLRGLLGLQGTAQISTLLSQNYINYTKQTVLLTGMARCNTKQGQGQLHMYVKTSIVNLNHCYPIHMHKR